MYRWTASSVRSARLRAACRRLWAYRSIEPRVGLPAPQARAPSMPAPEPLHGRAVTVFGSARFKASHPYYKMARSIGAQLARAGFATFTGGGPGIMEAANRGAHDAGGR